MATVVAAAPAQAITGGTAVPDAAAAPWMVTLAHTGDEPLVQRAFCGGALIAQDRVLTAAHCVAGSDPRNLEIHLGASVLSREPGRILPIEGVAVHPEFGLIPSPVDPSSPGKSSAVDDVAIIGLARPVSDVVLLAVAEEAPLPGAAVTAYGHGITAPPSTDPATPPSVGDVLQKADLGLISAQDCATRLRTPSGSDGSVVCAQAPEPAGPTTCAGDSGGPLVQWADGRAVLVGVTSFGGEVIDQECRAGMASAFANTAALHDWITQPDPTFEPSPAQDVVVAGDPAVGSTLTCRTPTWDGGEPATLAYAWSRSEINTNVPEEAWNTPTGFLFFVQMDGQTAPTLTVSPDLAGHEVTCSIEARNAGGSVSYFSDGVTIGENR